MTNTGEVLELLDGIGEVHEEEEGLNNQRVGLRGSALISDLFGTVVSHLFGSIADAMPSPSSKVIP